MNVVCCSLCVSVVCVFLLFVCFMFVVCVLFSRDLLPVVSSLRHNTYFEGVVETAGKVSADILEELWYVLRSSQAIKTLVIANCALKP